MTGSPHRRGRQSLVRRTRRALLAVLGWGLVTAVVSLAAISSLVSGLRNEARQADAATELLSDTQRAANEAEGAAHDLIELGADGVDYFTDIHDEVLGLFAAGEELLAGEPAAEQLAAARDVWDEMYAPLVALAADPDAGDSAGDLHDHLGVEGERFRTALYDLDEVVRQQTRTRLDQGETAQRNLTIALTALFGMSLASTIVFARRMRSDVVGPVQDLGSSARRFASGEFEHRSTIDRPDEFAELAETFNAMADALDANRETLVRQAYHDTLTGLPNRRCFVERLADGFAGARSAPTGVGVLFVDLDDFKVVNDTFGHAAGDGLLREVAKRLTAELRSSDLVARLGGDEFAVLLGAPTDVDTAQALARRILATLSEPIVVEQVALNVGASIGVAIQRPDTPSADELLQQADLVMYLAKGRGKRRVEVYDGAAHSPLRRSAG